MRETRRPVRRSGVVDRYGDPWGDGGHELELGDAYEARHRQLVGRLTGAHAVQPHDVTVTVIELRAVVIMRSELVRLKMPVCDGVRVITVRFVHMLGRKGRRHGEPRRQNEADDEPAESMRHASRLWLRTSRGVKRFGWILPPLTGLASDAGRSRRPAEMGRGPLTRTPDRRSYSCRAASASSAAGARRLGYRVHTLAPNTTHLPDRSPTSR